MPVFEDRKTSIYSMSATLSQHCSTARTWIDTDSFSICIRYTCYVLFEEHFHTRWRETGNSLTNWWADWSRHNKRRVVKHNIHCIENLHLCCSGGQYPTFSGCRIKWTHASGMCMSHFSSKSKTAVVLSKMSTPKHMKAINRF